MAYRERACQHLMPRRQAQMPQATRLAILAPLMPLLIDCAGAYEDASEDGEFTSAPEFISWLDVEVQRAAHCLRCTPWPKAKVNPFKPSEVIQPPRRSVALVRADLFDRDDFMRRQMVAAKRALAAKLDAKHPVKMSPEQLAEAHAAASWLAGFTEEP